MQVDFFNSIIETASAADLRALVTAKLRRQMSYLYHRSGYYRTVFDGLGLKPRHIRQVADIKVLPFTYKDQLRKSQEHYPPLGDYMAADWQEVVRIHASSGTTGVPSFVGITRRDKEVWTEMAARCAYARGVRPTSIVIHAYALSFFVGGLPVKDGIEAIGATFIPLGVGASEQLVEAIRRLRPDILSGTPSYMLYLLKYLRETSGLEPTRLGLKKLIGGGEPGIGNPSLRGKIEEGFGADAYEAMGNADLGAVIFAECPEKAGMHFLAPDFILPEIIDAAGESLAIEEGVQGELVGTTLDRECNPVVRFRTGDWVKVWDALCKCGRTGFRLRCLGRTDDMLIIRGVNVFPSAIQDVVASFKEGATGAIEIHLPHEGPAVEPPVKILAECRLTPELWPNFRAKLEEALREKLLFRAQVELVASGSLPAHQEKTRLTKVLKKV